MNNIYSINPKDHGKNIYLIVFLSVFGFVWFVSSLFIIRKLFIEFSYIGLFFSFLSTGIAIFIAWILLGMNQKQYISVQDEDLLIKASLFTQSADSIPKG